MTARVDNIPPCICGISDCPIPYGLCHCGCGKETSISPRTDRCHGMIRGCPRKYAYSHHGDTHLKPVAPKRQKPFRIIDFALTLSDLDRFWRKIDKTPGHGPQGECWVWTAAVMKNGYGVFSMSPKYRMFLAHRASWFIEHGSLPPDKEILHHCDNPPCVRPDHLFIGTQTDNMQDCAAKNRTSNNGLYGEKIGAHKLTEKQVLEIRELHRNEPRTYEFTAKQYGVSDGTISQVVRRKRWTHI